MPARTLRRSRREAPEAGAGEWSFESYVRARSTALLRTAYLLTGDQHLAEDLVQSALVRAHARWDSISRDGNPEPYVRKVIYHLQVSAWRRRRVSESLWADVPEPTAPDGATGGEDPAAGVALRVVLRAALLTLPPRQRAVIVLRYFDDRTEVETAEMLGCSVGTIKSQHSRAVVRLRGAPGLHGLSIDDDGRIR